MTGIQIDLQHWQKYNDNIKTTLLVDIRICCGGGGISYFYVFDHLRIEQPTRKPRKRTQSTHLINLSLHWAIMANLKAIQVLCLINLHSK